MRKAYKNWLAFTVTRGAIVALGLLVVWQEEQRGRRLPGYAASGPSARVAGNDPAGAVEWETGPGRGWGETNALMVKFPKQVD